MRYLLVLLITILIGSCCRDKGLRVIQDKSWFPYKVKSNIIYKTKNDLIDSLSFVYLDTSNQWNHGDYCAGGYEEYRDCKLQSMKFKDLTIQISLDPYELGFKLDYMDKLTNVYIWNISNNPSQGTRNLNPIDSISLSNIVYRDVLILTDSLKALEIYYNRIGILRYILNKDTFDLKR